MTLGHAGALEDMAAATTAMLAPAALIGAAVRAVIAPAGSCGPGPGLCVWAARGAPATTWSLPAEIQAWPGGGTAGGGGLILASPAFPLASWLEHIGAARPGAAVVAARLGAPGAPPPTLVAGDQTFRGGAVGLGLGSRWGVTARIATGWRGVGPSLLVTRGERHMVFELDGTPAMTRLRTVARDQIPASDLKFMHHGLALGPDGSGQVGQPVRTVVGSDPDNGALALSGPLSEGIPVQFQVVDPALADARLRRALAGAPAALVLASGGLGGGGGDAAWGPCAGLVAEELVAPHDGQPEPFREGAVVLRFGSVPPRR
ncbi:MAG: FIST N-terminal domain-containing protein [Acidimicrobiales bacterium]